MEHETTTSIKHELKEYIGKKIKQIIEPYNAIRLLLIISIIIVSFGIMYQISHMILITILYVVSIIILNEIGHYKKQRR